MATIPDLPIELWNAHRNTIQSLYLDGVDPEGHRVPENDAPNRGAEGGLSLDSVRTHMATFYEFHPTKFHYEKRFKLWNLRKNLSGNEWRALDQIIKSRNTEGKSSEVYMSGRLVLKSKLNRQLRRYQIIQTGQTTQAVEVPWGIEIRTPPSIPTIEDAMNETAISSTSLESTNGLISPDYHTSPPSVQEMYHDSSPSFNQRRPVTEQPDEVASDISISVAENRMTQNSQLTATYGTRNSSKCSIEIQAQRSKLISMKNAMLTRTVLLEIKTFDFLQFLVQNNFTQVCRIGVLESLSDSTIRNLLRPSQTSSLQAQVAFENLVRFAIELGDIRLIKTLIRNSRGSFDPKTFLCVVEGIHYTPLERSASLCHVNLTRTLIAAGADHNQSYSNTGPLECAFISQYFSSEIKFRDKKLTIQAILQKNPRITRSSFEHAVTLADIDILFQIITNPSAIHHISRRLSMTPDNLEPIRRGITLRNTMLDTWPMKLCKARSDNELSTLLNDLLSQLATLNNENYKPSILGYMTYSAAFFGHVNLLKLCLLHGSYGVSEALVVSIRHRSLDIAELILERGVNVDLHHCSRFTAQSIATKDKFGSFPHQDSTTPFAEAILSGEHGLYAYMVQHDAMANIKNSRSFESALSAAASIGNILLVEKLLKNYSRIYYWSGHQAIHSAIKNCHPEILFLLLESGANHMSGTSMVYEAIQKKDFKLIDTLLQIGAPLKPFEIDLLWCLSLSCQDFELVHRLIDTGFDLTIRHGSHIYEYLNRLQNEDEVIEILQHFAMQGMNLGADIRKSGGRFSGDSLVSLALKFDSPRLMELILNLGFKVTDLEVFLEVVSKGHKCLLSLLESMKKTHPDRATRFVADALRHAIIQQDNNLIDLLLPMANVHVFSSTGHEGSFTPFGEAIFFGNGAHTDLVRRMINAGADVNKFCIPHKDFFRGDFDFMQPHKESQIKGFQYPRPLKELKIGDFDYLQPQTPIMVAIRSTSLDMVRLLVGAGADINRPASYGLQWTPLQYAAKLGSYDIVQYLLDNHASVNAAPAFRGGGTALQCAAAEGWTGIAELLLESGAEINAAGSRNFGRTALQYAAAKGRATMVEYLLCKGADHVQIPMAGQLAKENGHFAIAKFLEKVTSEAHD